MLFKSMFCNIKYQNKTTNWMKKNYEGFKTYFANRLKLF